MAALSYKAWRLFLLPIIMALIFPMIDYLIIVVAALIATIGTAGVPSVGPVMLVFVLQWVGLPLEGIGLILGVDKFLEMFRTTVNITGDAMVACAVAKSENALDVSIYNSPKETS